MNEFEPKIVGFCCNWCSYAGADLAGVSRIQYPPNVRIIRVMCSGRIDPILLFETLINGADGILVLGCHPGDCHYLEGNYQAERKVRMAKKLMEQVGINPDRFHLDWVSASEGQRFANIIKEFVELIKNLGPNPIIEDGKRAQAMLAAKEAASGFRLRALVGRERSLIEGGNSYGEKILQGKFDEVMDDAIKAEYIRAEILLLTKKEPLSVKDMAKKLELGPQETLKNVTIMVRKNLLYLDHVEGTSPLYAAISQEVK